MSSMNSSSQKVLQDDYASIIQDNEYDVEVVDSNDDEEEESDDDDDSDTEQKK